MESRTIFPEEIVGFFPNHLQDVILGMISNLPKTEATEATELEVLTVLTKEEETERECSRCKEILPLEEFPSPDETNNLIVWYGFLADLHPDWCFCCALNFLAGGSAD